MESLSLACHFFSTLKCNVEVISMYRLCAMEEQDLYCGVQ